MFSSVDPSSLGSYYIFYIWLCEVIFVNEYLVSRKFLLCTYPATLKGQRGLEYDPGCLWLKKMVRDYQDGDSTEEIKFDWKYTSKLSDEYIL